MERIRMALETIEQLKTIKGVYNVHIVAIGWEEKDTEIAERAGLLPMAHCIEGQHDSFS